MIKKYIILSLVLILSFVIFSCMEKLEVSTPTFNPEPGSYDSIQHISISTTTEEATLYYTTDGSTPTTNSTEYNEPIEVNTTTTIQAIAVKGDEQSEVASGEYIITVATPTISHPYPSIEINCDTSGATIYYTTDGTTPTTSSSEYSDPLSLPHSITPSVKAFAVKDDMDDSNVATYTCSNCH